MLDTDFRIQKASRSVRSAKSLLRRFWTNRSRPIDKRTRMNWSARQRLQAAAVLAGPLALLVGFAEWSGLRGGTYGLRHQGPFANPVPLSDMWWHVPLFWLGIWLILAGVFSFRDRTK
jgi:hypothetical protein